MKANAYGNGRARGVLQAVVSGVSPWPQPLVKFFPSRDSGLGKLGS
jgi:hypothetical protein